MGEDFVTEYTITGLTGSCPSIGGAGSVELRINDVVAASIPIVGYLGDTVHISPGIQVRRLDSVVLTGHNAIPGVLWSKR